MRAGLATVLSVALATLACGRSHLLDGEGDASGRGNTRDVAGASDGPGARDAADAPAPDRAPVDAAGSPQGCADGEREAFRDAHRYPGLAGCAGGFSVPGLAGATTPGRQCGGTGDDAVDPSGAGCAAADLCAPGFHVCRGAAEVAARARDGCAGARDAPGGSFFATAQSGPACNACATGTYAACRPSVCRTDCAPRDDLLNDVFGCGDVGYPASPSCAPLDRSSGHECDWLPTPWSCPSPTGTDEAARVRKLGPEAGGVLCCNDEP